MKPITTDQVWNEEEEQLWEAFFKRSDAELAEAGLPVPNDTKQIDETLNERGCRYGEFEDHAKIAQTLKQYMHNTQNWFDLAYDQKEALDMIQHKIARILNGDPDYADSWHDIAGYASLIDKRLTKQK